MGPKEDCFSSLRDIKLTDVLMVTTTVGMLNGVHGHTTNLFKSGEKGIKNVEDFIIANSNDEPEPSIATSVVEPSHR